VIHAEPETIEGRAMVSRNHSIVGLLAAAAMLLSACGSFTAPESTGGAAAGPTTVAATPPVTAQPATPSPSAVIQELPDGGNPSFPGTYTTQFQPKLTFTIDHVVDLDCSPGYRCRGDVDLNSANFVDLEFGNVHGSEVHIYRLDKVYDPASPDKQIDPPVDLAAWMEALPGTAVRGPAMPVMIGGKPATRFDIRTPGEIVFGPLPGGPNDNAIPAGPQASIGPSALRISVMRIGGSAVLIIEWLGPENTVRDGAAALKGLQPLIDSITWL
jgi:hypothetical protein